MTQSWSVSTDSDFQADTPRDAAKQFLTAMRTPGPHSFIVRPIVGGDVDEDPANEHWVDL